MDEENNCLDETKELLDLEGDGSMINSPLAVSLGFFSENDTAVKKQLEIERRENYQFNNFMK